MSPRLEHATSPIQYRLERLRALPFCRDMDDFFRTPSYFVLLGFLTVFSAIGSTELMTYTVFILIGIFVALLGRDLLPLMPLVVLSYIAPSVRNNPGLNKGSLFYGWQGVYLLCIAVIFAACLLVRLFSDPQPGRKAFLKCKRSLLPGMLMLGAAYMLAGAFSGYYTAHGWRNAFFGFVQFLSVFLFYYLFTGAVRWEKAPRDYLAWCGVCMGLVLLFQLVHIYHVNNVILDGMIDRSKIYSGWGNCNNIGAMLTMTIPFAFQLSCQKKYPWLFEIIALLLMGGVVMTCSRGSLLVATVIYPISYAVMLRKTPNRRFARKVHTILVVILFAAVLVFRNELLHLFHRVLLRGMTPSGRDMIYKAGLEQFLRFPLFGGSFFPVDYSLHSFSTVTEFLSVFPPRWHNTFVQMLASCGIAGLAAYGYHRYQTVKLMCMNPTAGKAFIGLSLLALLATSMVDCHFFNIGPTLLYSVALAFGEKADTRIGK